MKSNGFLGCIQSLVASVITKINDVNTSVKEPFIKRGDSVKCPIIALLIVSLSIDITAFALHRAVGDLLLIHPLSCMTMLLIAVLSFTTFSVAVRPPREERYQTDEKSHFISPISLCYILLALPITFNLPFAAGAVVVSMITSLAIISLLAFEREQVLLSMDDATRHKAIMINGEMISEGIPAGYVTSVFGLLMIALTDIPKSVVKIKDFIISAT